MRALVVFGNEGEVRHPLSWMLKDGWKHCFLCLKTEGMWIRIDGEIGIPVVAYVAPADFDLATFYRDNDLTVVETEQGTKPLFSPFVINNCVGIVKAVLCLSAPWAQSPWRLYRFLTKESRMQHQTLPGFGPKPKDPTPLPALSARDDAAIAAEKERKRLANKDNKTKQVVTRLTPSDQAMLGAANTRGGSQLGGSNKTYKG